VRYPPNDGNQPSSQIELSDGDRTHTYQQLSPRVSQGFIYHFEPVIVAAVEQQEEPPAQEVGQVLELPPEDDSRSEISVSKFLKDGPNRLENSEDSEGGLL
jgi:hypothetical protein